MPLMQTLPVLRKTVAKDTGLRSVNATSSPHRGKAFIYAIEWGFRLDRANNYAARGVYIGLTHDAVIKRWYTHMMTSQRLKVYYDENSKSTGVTGEAGDKQAKLLYIAMAVAAWKDKKYIYPGFAYRAITPIAEPNLFDLAYQERTMIRKENSKSTIALKDNTYRGVLEAAAGARGRRLGFNSSDGGERAALNNPGPENRPSNKDKVMAAFYFIKEGRGSLAHPDSLRNTIGIVGPKRTYKSTTPEIPGLPNGVADMADDIDKVMDYFKNSASGFEKMNVNRISHNRGKKNPQMTPLDKLCLELGITYGKYGSMAMSENERNLNVLISLKNQPGVALTEDQLNNMIHHADKSARGGTIPKVSLEYISNIPSLKDTVKVAEKVASHPFFQEGYANIAALYKLERVINGKKKPKDPGYISLAYYIEMAKKDFNVAYRQLLRDHGSIVKPAREKNRGLRNFIRGYNAGL